LGSFAPVLITPGASEPARWWTRPGFASGMESLERVVQ
jgi:hypothetical protein